MPRLKDRLAKLFQQRFVGRDTERARFRQVVCASEATVAVFYIHGPGGVGKTQLLKMFLACCEEEKVPAVYLDGRNVEPSPDGFRSALEAARGAVDARRAAGSDRNVLLVDTYEALISLDDWLRDLFLPELPEETLVVLAGRIPPSVGWRSDLAWQALCQVMPLHNLNPEESSRYLTDRNVPKPQQQAVLDFTGGYPLGLALAADLFTQHPEIEFTTEPPPDLIHALLQRFVQFAPSPAHQAALESCALVRIMTEPLLEQMLDQVDVHELFNWLRTLSFIETGGSGLFAHDLAREVLATDLRWRNPDRRELLHNRAKSYYMARFQHADGRSNQEVLYDYLYLHRHNSVVHPFFDWNRNDTTFTDTLRPEDVAPLVAMTERHEGAESARLAAYWLKRQPQNALIFRNLASGKGTAAIIGWLMTVEMHAVAPEDLDADPGARAVHDFLHREEALEPGARSLLFRFWMAADAYQSVSYAQGLIFINAVRHQFTTPGLVYTLFPCADPDFWTPIFEFSSIPRTPNADFTVGERSYGVFSHDWRIVSPDAWLNRMGRREREEEEEEAAERAARQAARAARAAVLPRPRAEAEAPLLAREPFAEAVRSALRAFTRTDLLRDSPLLTCRIVRMRAPAGAGVLEQTEVLRALLKETAAVLLASPRDARLYRALELACFAPAPSQERAAEQLDISYATFRRHLSSGCERLTDLLWQKESDSRQK